MDDPYSVLNVFPDCTYEEAKAAYRKAALTHHPDRHLPPRKAEAERRFRIVSNAFQQVCLELGHPIEPPEIVPSVPPPPPSAKAPAVTERGSGSSLARIQPPRSARVPDEYAYEIAEQVPPPTRAPRTAPREELIRNREMDELEDQSPYDDDDALDPRPHYPHARPPTNAYAQDYHRAPSNPYPLDQPRRGYRDGNGAPGNPNGRGYERPAPEEYRHNNDEYPGPRRSVSSQYPAAQRRPSFSQPAHEWSGRRDLIEHESRPYGRGPQQRVVSHTDRPAQQDLYDLKPAPRRDGFGGGDEWDGAFGMGSDDFFGNGRSDPFSSGGHKMNDLGMGFDKLMSSAMNGLKLGGPGSGALEDLGTNPNCMMRMRQSKMVMGQNDDGSWTGRKMDKQMRCGNGRMEINENGQDIRIGGEAGDRTANGRVARNGNMRNGEDWDPPPAYEGDDDELGDPERHHHYSDDYHPQSQRRVAGPSLDRYGPERSDRDSQRTDRDLSRIERDPQHRDSQRMDRDFSRVDRDSQHMDRNPQRMDRDLSRMDRDPQYVDRNPQRMDQDLSRMDRDPQHMDRNPQRMDRDSQRIDRDSPNRSNDQLASRPTTRARPNPVRGYLDDGSAYGGYGGGSGAGPRGYLEDGPSGYEGGGGGLTRSQSSSQGRSHHPEGRSMVRRPDGPVVRR